MDIKKKVANALIHSFGDAYIRLEDDDGISGFMVSARFEDMPTLDRQRLIDRALTEAPGRLTTDERRRVLMIAGLTPREFDAVGARIRVHKLKEKASGTVEVLLEGGPSAAEYVRGALNNQRGVKTTEPKPCPGGPGGLMSFQAKRTETNPLTKAVVLRILSDDPYIQVMPNA